MSPKIWITIGLVIGSTVGSYLPTLWGADLLSLSSVIGTFIGGIIGVWLGYKIGQSFS